jgi:hypothetical protein
LLFLQRIAGKYILFPYRRGKKFCSDYSRRKDKTLREELKDINLNSSQL